jgi:hypothetical protein
MLALTYHPHRGPRAAHQSVKFTTQVAIGNVVSPYAICGVPLGVGCYHHRLDAPQPQSPCQRQTSWSTPDDYYVNGRIIALVTHFL